MRVAPQKTAIVTQKIIADEVQGRRHMPAAIDVCVKVAAIIYQKRVDSVVAADQPKLLDRSGSKIADPGNHAATAPTFRCHDAFIPRKKTATNR
jgi:hypothetical protein